MQSFDPVHLIPYMIPVIFVIAIIAGVILNRKKIEQHGAPVMQIWAQIIRIAPMPGTGEGCMVTFADAADSRFPMQIPPEFCDPLTEGAVGSLTYQGERFISFRITPD